MCVEKLHQILKILQNKRKYCVKLVNIIRDTHKSDVIYYPAMNELNITTHE